MMKIVCSFHHMLICVILSLVFFVGKQHTAYVMRISDWSSDGCSSDLPADGRQPALQQLQGRARAEGRPGAVLVPADRGGGYQRAGDRPGRDAARRGHAVRAVRAGDVVAGPQTAARRRCRAARVTWDPLQQEVLRALGHTIYRANGPGPAPLDRKSTRLNSSH